MFMWVFFSGVWALGGGVAQLIIGRGRLHIGWGSCAVDGVVHCSLTSHLITHMIRTDICQLYMYMHTDLSND